MPKKHLMILGYLHRYGSIDRQRALSHFEVWDLPAQISKIRKMKIRVTSKGQGRHLKYTIQAIANKYKVNEPQQMTIPSPSPFGEGRGEGNQPNMSNEHISEVSTLLDQWLEYGDLKELADKYLKGKYRYEYASKVKRMKIRNHTFMLKLIEKAIYRKSLFTSATQRLSA